MAINTAERIDRYVGVSRKEVLSFITGKEPREEAVARRLMKEGSRRFLVAIYGAEDACGLIGCEYNGIAIFDENKKRVLLDRHMNKSSGWSGPSRIQREAMDRIMAMAWEEFQEFVNAHKRARYYI